MQLTVKALQGRECSLQVAEDELVSTLKHLVSDKLNVPVRQQRLLFKGKALAARCCSASLWLSVAGLLPSHLHISEEGTTPISLWQMKNDCQITTLGPILSST
uniref:Ubiquitin-like 4A n=1 Tax=Mus musculus TaxID=10090 RepID=F8WHM4_MOUSE